MSYNETKSVFVFTAWCGSIIFSQRVFSNYMAAKKYKYKYFKPTNETKHRLEFHSAIEELVIHRI